MYTDNPCNHHHIPLPNVKRQPACLVLCSFGKSILYHLAIVILYCILSLTHAFRTYFIYIMCSAKHMSLQSRIISQTQDKLPHAHLPPRCRMLTPRVATPRRATSPSVRLRLSVI
jgi:hypothetical protein